MANSGSSDPVGPERMVINASRAAEVALNPTNMMRARPFTPRRSLSQPVANTDTAPTPGKMELRRAALLALYPRWSLKYCGVHWLKLSRMIVHPKDRKQTSRNARLRSSGSSRAATLFGRDSELANKLSGLGLASV